MQPAFRPAIIALAALLAHSAVGCGRSSGVASVLLEFSPERWPEADRARYLALQGLPHSDAPKRLQQAALSAKGMVAGTSDPFAVHAGLEILKRGGSAADAALTTALTQVALTAGSTVSYAGTLTAVYYEASSEQTVTLNAAYQTVQQETDPGTIPGIGSLIRDDRIGPGNTRTREGDNPGGRFPGRRVERRPRAWPGPEVDERGTRDGRNLDRHPDSRHTSRADRRSPLKTARVRRRLLAVGAVR